MIQRFNDGQERFEIQRLHAETSIVNDLIQDGVIEKETGLVLSAFIVNEAIPMGR